MAKQSGLRLTPQLLLRLGLAFVFTYAALSSLLHPLEWAGYVPHFISIVVPQLIAVRLIAIYELILASWLLTNRYHKQAALLSAATLAGIVVLNLGQLIVTFRDVGLLCMALALYLE